MEMPKDTMKNSVLYRSQHKGGEGKMLIHWRGELLIVYILSAKITSHEPNKQLQNSNNRKVTNSRHSQTQLQSLWGFIHAQDKMRT